MTSTRPSSTSGVAELRREVFGLRFSNATGELDDTAGLGRAKRDLARALTVVRERALTGIPSTAGQASDLQASGTPRTRAITDEGESDG